MSFASVNPRSDCNYEMGSWGAWVCGGFVVWPVWCLVKGHALHSADETLGSQNNILLIWYIQCCAHLGPLHVWDSNFSLISVVSSILTCRMEVKLSCNGPDVWAPLSAYQQINKHTLSLPVRISLNADHQPIGSCIPCIRWFVPIR